VNGYWGIYPLMFGKRAFTPRHLIPMVFVTTLLAAGVLNVTWSGARWVLGGIVGLYLAALGVAAARIAWRERDPLLGLVLPLAFAGLHLPYGIGSLWASVEVMWHRLRGQAPEKQAVYR